MDTSRTLKLQLKNFKREFPDFWELRVWAAHTIEPLLRDKAERPFGLRDLLLVLHRYSNASSVLAQLGEPQEKNAVNERIAVEIVSTLERWYGVNFGLWVDKAGAGGPSGALYRRLMKRSPQVWD